MAEARPHPLSINLLQKSRLLALEYSDGAKFELSCEFLRVHSPSAEVRGHGPGQEVLQVGKENVNIKDIEPMGHYAVRLVFDDGHESGIFTWDYLYELGMKQDQYWQRYLAALAAAGRTRAAS
jgi:DUF971 family protein